MEKTFERAVMWHKIVSFKELVTFRTKVTSSSGINIFGLYIVKVVSLWMLNELYLLVNTKLLYCLWMVIMSLLVGWWYHIYRIGFILRYMFYFSNTTQLFKVTWMTCYLLMDRCTNTHIFCHALVVLAYNLRPFFPIFI